MVGKTQPAGAATIQAANAADSMWWLTESGTDAVRADRTRSVAGTSATVPVPTQNKHQPACIQCHWNKRPRDKVQSSDPSPAGVVVLDPDRPPPSTRTFFKKIKKSRLTIVRY